MGDWPIVTLGMLCASGQAEIQTGPFGSQLHSYDYVTRGVPVVPTEAIENRRIDHSVLPHISEQKAASLNRHILRPGDILFARRGVQATGKTALVREAEAGFLCGTGAIRFRLRRSAQNVLPEFLSLVLAAPSTVEWFKFHAIGATMPNLNEGIVKSFSFATPSVNEQRSIASLLCALDDKSDLNRQMNETLETIARAIFKDWLVDFGPTRAKVERRAPYLSVDLWSLFPDRLDDEGKPEGWDSVALGEVIALNPSERLPQGTIAPYLDMAAIPVRGSWPQAPVLRAASSGSRFRNGDTLLARITPCLENGKTAFVARIEDGKVGWGSTEFIVMRPQPPFPSEFGYLLARDDSFRAHAILSMTGTSGRQRVQSEALRNFPIVKPSNQVLERLSEYVAGYFELIGTNERQSETLAATRDLLLPKLMSGEIRIKDAEKVVEMVL
jgi:type I restriction enzyme S subunit